jgi:hypothetical protein
MSSFMKLPKCAIRAMFGETTVYVNFLDILFRSKIHHHSGKAPSGLFKRGHQIKNKLRRLNQLNLHFFFYSPSAHCVVEKAENKTKL